MPALSKLPILRKVAPNAGPDSDSCDLECFHKGQLVHICINTRPRKGPLKHKIVICTKYLYKIFQDFPYFEIILCIFCFVFFSLYIFEANMSVLQWNANDELRLCISKVLSWQHNISLYYLWIPRTETTASQPFQRMSIKASLGTAQ